MEDVMIHLGIYGEKSLKLVRSALETSRHFSVWNVKLASDNEVIYVLTQLKWNVTPPTEAKMLIAKRLEEYARLSEESNPSSERMELKRLARCIRGEEADDSEFKLDPLEASAVETLEAELNSLEEKWEDEVAEATKKIDEKYDARRADIKKKLAALRKGEKAVY